MPPPWDASVYRGYELTQWVEDGPIAISQRGDYIEDAVDWGAARAKVDAYYDSVR